MHKSKAADLQGIPKNRPTFGHSVHTRMGNKCPTLVQLMPIAWSVDAHRLVPECPLDEQDIPPDGL